MISPIIQNRYTASKTPFYGHKKQSDVVTRLLKIHKILTIDETQDVLWHKKSFFDTNYEYFYDELNEIANGKMPPSLKNQMDIYERETGVKLHVDNNLDDKKFGYAMNALYYFYDINKLKGYEMPKDIYITRFLEENLGGLYDGESEVIYLYPSYEEDYKAFFTNIHHENMHHRDRERLTQGTKYFINSSSRKEKKAVAKVLRPYAISKRSEFCACLAEKIDNGELYVVQNKNGETFLRKYITSKNNATKEDLEIVAKLYRKFKCPKFTPTQPPKTYLPYIEAQLD